MLARSPHRPRRPIAVLHAAETGIGGINSIIVGLGTSQVARFGHGNVHVLVPREHVGDYAGTAIVPHVFRRGARSLRSCLAFTLGLARLVLAHRPAFVVLHSSFAGLAGRLVLLALSPMARPVVIYCAHGWAFTMATTPFRRRAFAWVERRLAQLSAAVVNISEAEHAAALAAGLPPERLHCIPNGTPRPPADPGPSPYPPGRAGPGKERLNLLFVGRLDRQKGIDVLLAALAANPGLPVHLTVVGSAVVEPVGLRALPNVTFVGWLPRDALAPYYAHADAVVVPSRWEGFGLVAAEALSFGTPVVASRVGGLAAIVEDGVSGRLVEPACPEALADALAGLDRAGLRGMRAAAARRWERVADLDAMNGRYFELMRSLTVAGRRESAARAGEAKRPAKAQVKSQVKPDGLA